MSRACVGRILLGCLFGLAACASTAALKQRPLGDGWRAISLGAAQDAGRPHLGCFKSCCESARAEGLHEPVAALAIEDASGWWLIDATPDLPEQVHAMGSLPRGILLTHAHIGHYTGLMYLGREGMNARGMPVYASTKMADFLRSNAPWDQLVRLGNIELMPFESQSTIQLDARLSVVAHAVPHRNEYADTHAFAIGGLLYVPDIDRWEDWDLPWSSYDALVADGTFFSGTELPGRDLREIPHPTIEHTLALLRDAPAHPSVWFTHLNHTNPLWDRSSAQAQEFYRQGGRLALAGEVVYRSPSAATAKIP
jgi:pyrroloquinoline quinone biosynthesis protein B